MIVYHFNYGIHKKELCTQLVSTYAFKPTFEKYKQVQMANVSRQMRFKRFHDSCFACHPRIQYQFICPRLPLELYVGLQSNKIFY